MAIKKPAKEKGAVKAPPFDGIRYHSRPDEEDSAAENNRKYLRAIAERLDAGGQLEGALEKALVAAALRAVAIAPLVRSPNPPGQRPILDPGVVAEQFALLIHGHGLKPAAARGELADRFGVTDEAIRKSLTKYGPAALRIFAALGASKIK